MYKDFVNVTPESGGAGTTPIAVAADENEGAARSTSLKRKCLWKTKLKLNIG